MSEELGWSVPRVKRAVMRSEARRKRFGNFSTGHRESPGYDGGSSSGTGVAERMEERSFLGAMRCPSRSGWNVFVSWPLAKLTITKEGVVVGASLPILRRFIPSRTMGWQEIEKIERVKAGVRILAKGMERDPVIFLLRPFLLLSLRPRDEEVLQLLEDRGVPVDRSLHPTHWFGAVRSQH
jgi:hypothetical protein